MRVVSEGKGLQAPGTARDVSSLASYALGLACGTSSSFRLGLPAPWPMRGDIDGLLSAACMGVGRSLQACCATQVDRSATSWR